MGDANQTLDTQQRNQILNKFDETAEINEITVWQTTIAQERDDLKLLLLSDPTTNDAQDYLAQRILDWIVAKETADDVRKKIILKIIATYTATIEYLDTL